MYLIYHIISDTGYTGIVNCLIFWGVEQVGNYFYSLSFLFKTSFMLISWVGGVAHEIKIWLLGIWGWDFGLGLGLVKNILFIYQLALVMSPECLGWTSDSVLVWVNRSSQNRVVPNLFEAVLGLRDGNQLTLNYHLHYLWPKPNL